MFPSDLWTILFQSLFFWIPLFRDRWRRCSMLESWVSILVFLDTSVPGGRSQIDFIVSRAVSILVFLDTSVPGMPSRFRYRDIYTVSILVFLDTSVPGEPIAESDVRIKFQSLFFWIPLFRA